MWPFAWTPYCIDDVRRGRKLTGSVAAGPNGRNGGCLGPEWEAGWSHITSYIQYWSRNRRTRHSPGKERSVTEIWVAGRCYPLRAVGVGVSSDVHDTGSDRRGTVRISGPSLNGTVNLDAEHIPPRKVQDPGSDTSTGAPRVNGTAEWALVCHGPYWISQGFLKVQVARLFGIHLVKVTRRHSRGIRSGRVCAAHYFNGLRYRASSVHPVVSQAWNNLAPG